MQEQPVNKPFGYRLSHQPSQLTGPATPPTFHEWVPLAPNIVSVHGAHIVAAHQESFSKGAIVDEGNALVEGPRAAQPPRPNHSRPPLRRVPAFWDSLLKLSFRNNIG